MIEGGSVRPVQATARRIGTWFALAALAVAVNVGCAYSASPRSACANDVLHDWTQGTLDSSYPADCYEAALDALPEDLRAYTTAADDISRVAISATREATARELTSTPVANESMSAVPLPVLFLGAFVGVLVASGLVASIVRRRRAR
jgi:hypothetical protein